MTTKQIKQMKTYALYWSPEGRKIAVVQAVSAHAAIRKAPAPFNKYLGEIYAVSGDSLASEVFGNQ